ncbi:hypothetical protein [Rubneribacter sp.]
MTDRKQETPEPPPAPETRQSGGGDPGEPRPNGRNLGEAKSAQTLVALASVFGPVSLFIGGVFLSTAGLICAIIAYRKLGALAKTSAETLSATTRLKRSSIVAMAVCAIAVVLNAVSVYLLLPELVAMLESGDYATLANLGGAATGASSTWG